MLWIEMNYVVLDNDFLLENETAGSKKNTIPNKIT